MQDYSLYKKEDFLADESFTNFLLAKNDDDFLFWQNWIPEHPHSVNEIKKATDIFFAIRNRESISKNFQHTIGIENEFSKVKRSLNLTDAEKQTIIKKLKPRSVIVRAAWYLAGAAAIFIIAFSVINYVKTSSGPTQYISYASTTNVPTKITLPDGSMVLLNSNSEVFLAKKFNDSRRELLLKGTAFFSVAKNKAKPFIVTSGNLKTTALGTAFYIYQSVSGGASISLLEGKVEVRDLNDALYLLPGDKAAYLNEQNFDKISFNKEQLRQYVEGNIVFKNADIDNIESAIEEFFNKSVIIKGKVPKINFTGSFDSQKLESVLDALQFTYNMKYKLEGSHLILTF